MVKKISLKEFASKFNLVENFEYVLKDKDGNIKPLFQLNKLGQLLLKFGAIHPHSSKLMMQLMLLGNWSNKMTMANLVTNAGFAGIASRINAAGAEAAFTYLAIGIGTTAAAAGDTTLESEITTGGGERAASTASRVTTTQTNDTAQLVNTFAFTSTFAVTEAGSLNAASTGVLANRQVFTAVNVLNGDSLQITMKLKVATV